MDKTLLTDLTNCNNLISLLNNTFNSLVLNTLIQLLSFYVQMFRKLSRICTNAHAHTYLRKNITTNKFKNISYIRKCGTNFVRYYCYLLNMENFPVHSVLLCTIYKLTYISVRSQNKREHNLERVGR